MVVNSPSLRRAVFLVTVPGLIHQLFPHLLAIAHRVVGAEGDHLSVGGQKFHTALHRILHVERPWVHEVAGVDHEDVTSEVEWGMFAEGEMRMAGDAALFSACRFDGW